MQNTVSVSDHLERIKAAVAGTYGLTTLDGYISSKTFLNGKPYSFKDHEFQLDIARSTALEDITVKIAQVGVSEYYYRWALAACRNIDDFTVIYTFPNASDAEQVCGTRINPIIDSSPDLQNSVSKSINNTAVKQFGRNSFLYMRGTRSQAGAISVPADCIINDEWDKSDIPTATMYVARLQHKPYKLWKKFSTPTYAKYGILKEAETAKRMKHMKTCQCCNHAWVPDYFNDVKIPGYDGDLRDINKVNLKNIAYEKAVLLCPRCGREPGSDISTMQWVQENPDEKYDAVARFISPFSAPGIITMPYLIRSSTLYEKYSEFMNQGLGIAAEASDENINEADVARALVQADLSSSDLHVLGADMGLTCHVMVGRMTQDGTLLVVHRERIPLMRFIQRRMELMQKYKVCLSVHDTQPYVDMIQRITQADVNAYGSIFAAFKGGPMFRVSKEEEDKEEGKMELRQIKIRRNVALDSVMNMIKSGVVKIAKEEVGDDNDEMLTAQLTSMKRIQKFDENDELSYVWEKTDGNDHYMMALLYLYTAATLRGMSLGSVSPMQGLPIMSVVKGGSQQFGERESRKNGSSVPWLRR